MKKTLALLTVLSAFTASPAFAQSADVEFEGTVAATCTVIASNGNLAPSVNNDVLSSKTAAGTSGGAVVTTTGYNFDVSVQSPSDFSAYPTGPGGYTPGSATLVADMTVGGTNYAAGADADMTAGVNNVTVDLVATAATGESFPNGSYTAIVVLTCE